MKSTTSRAGFAISAVALAVALAGCGKNPQVEQAGAPATDVAPAASQPSAAAPSLVELNEAQRQASRASFDNCNLEALDGTAFGGEPEYAPADKGKITLGGWLGASSGEGVPAEPLLLLMLNERVWTLPIAYNVDRSDVAAHTGKAALQHSGFNITFDATSLPNGVYRAVLADGMTSYCDNGRRLKL